MTAAGALVIAVIVVIVIASTAFGHHSSNGGGSGNYNAGSNYLSEPTDAPNDNPTDENNDLASDSPTDEDLAPTDDPASTEDDDEPSTPAEETTPTLPPLTPGVGQVVMDSDHAGAICEALPGGGGVDSLDVLTGGRAIIECDTADSSGRDQTTLVGYNLMSQSQLWTYSVPKGVDYAISGQHIIEIDSIDHPAVGLQDEYTTYTMTAIDLSTGQKSWTIPYGTWLSSSDMGDANGLAVTESPSGIAGHPEDIVVAYFDVSAFDASSGKSLWHGPLVHDQSYELQAATGGEDVSDSGATYVTNGIAVDVESEDATGDSASTGNQLWQVDFPDWLQGTVSEASVDGTTELNGGDAGYIKYDVATGHVIGSGQFTESLDNVLLTQDYAVGNTGSRLELFDLADTKKPVWSIPAAGNVSPVAVSSAHILVAAPAGDVILSAKDGSTIATFSDSSDFDPSVSRAVVDGLVVGDNDDVLELDPPAGH